jgi:hypothetical protein
MLQVARSAPCTCALSCEACSAHVSGLPIGRQPAYNWAVCTIGNGSPDTASMSHAPVSAAIQMFRLNHNMIGNGGLTTGYGGSDFVVSCCDALQQESIVDG